MSKEGNIVAWEYPEQLHDDEGYPTDAALDYLRNWALIWRQLDEPKVGRYFSTEEDLYHLVDYLKVLWWMPEDGVELKDGLLELHTFGWSGNEDIVAILKDTNLWLTKFQCKSAGGHYYFKIDAESEYDWHIVKSKDK